MSLLKGIRVIDCTRIFAGPLCSQMLADQGAEVIKIETPGIGDPTRKWGPPFMKDTASYFNSCNRNKKSVCLDLRSDSDLEILYDLVSDSDIFMHNFLKADALSYEKLSALNKGLIYGTISGFGLKGNLAQKPAFDFTI